MAEKIGYRLPRWSLALCMSLGVAAQPVVAGELPVTSLSDGRVGQIAFQSMMVKWFADLAVPAALPKVTISGTLNLPKVAAGKVPAMVISHASSRPGPHEAEWADLLNGMGIATFQVDSFTGRGVFSTASNQQQTPTTNDMVDSLNALKLLASHPRIDATRIGVIGFSRGGNVALYTLLEPVHKSVISDNLRFAAHVAYYPACSTYYFSDHVDRSPTLVLLGSADDETPAAQCQSVDVKLRARGASIREVVYPGAPHAFDQNRPVTYVQNQTLKNCGAEQNLDTWQATVTTTGAVVTAANVGQFIRGCATTGANEGLDFNARRQSIEDVRAFLKETLHP